MATATSLYPCAGVGVRQGRLGAPQLQLRRRLGLAGRPAEIRVPEGGAGVVAEGAGFTTQFSLLSPLLPAKPQLSLPHFREST